MLLLVFIDHHAATGVPESNFIVMMFYTEQDGHWKNNVVIYNALFKYKFIGVNQVGSEEVGQGVNEKGFAIISALSKDLRKRIDKRNFSMPDVLGNCATVADFEEFLKNTNARLF